MSNLGHYQKMTTLAKKVHGPLQLGALVSIMGYLCIRGIEISVKELIKIVKKSSSTKDTGIIFDVHTNGSEKNGASFKVGDKYRILNIMDDVALIEKIGDENPYIASMDFLTTVSNYQA